MKFLGDPGLPQEKKTCSGFPKYLILDCWENKKTAKSSLTSHLFHGETDETCSFHSEIHSVGMSFLLSRCVLSRVPMPDSPSDLPTGLSKLLPTVAGQPGTVVRTMSKNDLISRNT